MRSLLLLILLCFFCVPAADAQNAPIPPSKSKEIGQIDQKLKSGKKDTASLEKDLKSIEKDLKGTKHRLVKTAKKVQSNERTLQDLDLKIKELEKEKASLSDKIQNDRGSIAKLILALERIKRLPPEALIARPEAPLKTAQSAMLLEEILPALNKQASDLKSTLQSLQKVSDDLQAKKDKVKNTTEALTQEQKELNALVKKRTDLYASTQKDLAAQKKKVAAISAQAKTLADLVKRLDEERTRSQKAAPKQKRVISAKAPKPGQPRLPLPGIIVTGYNEPDNFGAPSQGIDIEGRAGALVVAPMGGIVRFAGYFKNYGNMIILEHEKGWHSLIAGLENVDTVVGQSIGVGEPLGVLHKSSNAHKPVLYYELRHKGKAVNPAKKFGDLT